MQNKGADYQHSNGLHGCGVPSEDNNALGSPLPLPLQVIPPMMLCTLTFYTWIVLLSPILRQIILLFLDGTITVLVGGMSYCLFDLGLRVRSSWYLDINRHLPFQLHHNNYVSTKCLLHHISVKFHYTGCFRRNIKYFRRWWYGLFWVNKFI
jgi:hypothetical protein